MARILLAEDEASVRAFVTRALESRDHKVPDEADLQRSREILEELHHRAGEFRRPVIERDYIRRLLRRF